MLFRSQKAVDASFIIKQDEAQLSIEKNKIIQATIWENPTLEMSFHDGLSNNIDYTYFEFSQKLPAWGETSFKKQAAQFSLQSAQYAKGATLLKVQYRAASLFQDIYFLKKKVDILNQQLITIRILQEKLKAREDLGEVSGFESSRIEILRQQVIIKKQSLQNYHIKLALDAQLLLKVDKDISILGTIVKPEGSEIQIMLESLKKSPEYAKYEAMQQVEKQGLDRKSVV